MATGKLVGHQQCPEHPAKPVQAEIKLDKAGNPYRWCPFCNAQYFTRGDDLRVHNLYALMVALPPEAAPVPAVEPKPAPAAPATEPAPVKKRTGFALGAL